MSSLHIYRLSAERLSEYVEVLIVDEREFEFGCVKASYQYERRCETAKAAGKLFPGNCDREPREIQSDIVRHHHQTQNQVVWAAGASKKAETRVARSHSWRILGLFGNWAKRAKSRHNLKRLKLVFFLSLVWQCRNCRCKSALRHTLLR